LFVQAAALKQPVSKVYQQIQRPEASHHIQFYFSQGHVINEKANFYAIIHGAIVAAAFNITSQN